MNRFFLYALSLSCSLNLHSNAFVENKHTEEIIYKVIGELCKDNSLAQAQLFKGDGSYHLLRLIRKLDIPTINFLYSSIVVAPIILEVTKGCTFTNASDK